MTGSLGARLQRARERVDMARPVRAAVAAIADRNGRAHQGDVGDFDLPDQKPEEAKPDHELLGGERGGAGMMIAEPHVVETHAAGRKQRNSDLAAQHRVETGDRLDLCLHALPHGVRRDRQREREQYAKAHRKDGSDGKSKALDADGHGTEFPACGDER